MHLRQQQTTSFGRNLELAQTMARIGTTEDETVSAT
jgi:hypothetical protein